ncbi:MAG: beta-ketoacyl-ACP synthase III [Planctomycetota bacterium]|jgi:3-oxoacyl-[acyl-carrier-protein] synthase-3
MSSENSETHPKRRAVIIGHGSFVPEKVLTNEDLSKIVDTSDEWITTRTGIKRRHITSDEETTALLATEAAKKALANAGVKGEEIELIIIGTITPEMVFPSTACFVQRELGAGKAWAFDLSAACSGFLYGLSVAQQYIENGIIDKALVIGAETLSKITNYKERVSCVLFGDGAGAVILEGREDDHGILYSKMCSGAEGLELIQCKAYGSLNPVSRPLENPDMVYMWLNGRAVFQQATRWIIESVEECMRECKLNVEDVTLVIPHQMNSRIIHSVAKRMQFTDEQIFVNISEYGNTSAASIPIAFDEAMESGRLKKGDIVIFAAFGAGFTWGVKVIKI